MPRRLPVALALAGFALYWAAMATGLGLREVDVHWPAWMIALPTWTKVAVWVGAPAVALGLVVGRPWTAVFDFGALIALGALPEYSWEPGYDPGAIYSADFSVQEAAIIGAVSAAVAVVSVRARGWLSGSRTRGQGRPRPARA